MVTIEQLQKELKKKLAHSKKMKKEYDFPGTQIKYMKHETEESVYAEILGMLK